MKKSIAVALVFIIFVFSLSGCTKEKKDPNQYAMYTDNFQITKGMLEYCFNSQYISFVAENEADLEEMGLSTSQSLAEQKCSINGTNWYDYFMDTAKGHLEQCLIISEMALNKEKTLTQSEVAEVKEQLDELNATAEAEGITINQYVDKYFGENVLLQDIFDVCKMEYLAGKYFNEFAEKLDTGDKAVEKYYDGHKKLYTTVNYLQFFVSPLGDEAKDDTSARRTALLLSEAEDKEEFLSLVGNYVTEYYNNYYTEKVTKKELKSYVKKAQDGCVVNGAGYNSSSAASRWAFSDERKINEGMYFEDTENGGYSVYYLTSLPAREEYNAVSIRQIIYDIEKFDDSDSALEAAQEAILNLELNNYSNEYFEKLVKEQSADNFSKDTGGLYENITKGNLVEAPELEEWIFSDKRKAGDITLLQTANYGYHVIYIEEIEKPVWLLQAREGMINSRFNEHIADLGDDYVVYINDNIVYGITEVDATYQEE